MQPESRQVLEQLKQTIQSYAPRLQRQESSDDACLATQRQQLQDKLYAYQSLFSDLKAQVHDHLCATAFQQAVNISNSHPRVYCSQMDPYDQSILDYTPPLHDYGSSYVETPTLPMQAPSWQHEKSEALDDLDDDEDVLNALKSMPNSPGNSPAKTQVSVSTPIWHQSLDLPLVHAVSAYGRRAGTSEELWNSVAAHMTRSFPRTRKFGATAQQAEARWHRMEEFNFLEDWLQKPTSSQKFKMARKARQVWERHKFRNQS